MGKKNRYVRIIPLYSIDSSMSHFWDRVMIIVLPYEASRLKDPATVTRGTGPGMNHIVDLILA